MTNKTPKAVFLDRDGTLIRDKNYLSKVEDIEYYTDTFQALALIRSKGFELFVITNQSGVGRGFFTIDAVSAIHKMMDADMKFNKLPPYKGWGVCPHAPDDNCSCRKPEPKMILDFIKKYDLDKSQCWMVGDKEIDAEAGIKAGIKAAIIREPKSKASYPYFETLLDFAKSLE